MLWRAVAFCWGEAIIIQMSLLQSGRAATVPWIAPWTLWSIWAGVRPWNSSPFPGVGRRVIVLAAAGGGLAAMAAHVFVGSTGIFFTRDEIRRSSASNRSSIRAMPP